MFFRCGTKMSFRAVRKPHMKNSVVAIAIALLSVEAGTVVTIGDCGVAIAMHSDLELNLFQKVRRRLRKEKTIAGLAWRQCQVPRNGREISDTFGPASLFKACNKTKPGIH